MKGTASVMLYDLVAIIFVAIMISALFTIIYISSSSVTFADMHIRHVGNETQITITIYGTAKSMILRGVEIYTMEKGSIFKYTYGMVDDTCRLTRDVRIVGMSVEKLCKGALISPGSTITIILGRNVDVIRVFLHLEVEGRAVRVSVYR